MISSKILLLFVGTVTFQVLGFYLMPLSKGLTNLPATIGMFISFALGIAILSRLSFSGVNLSLLVPLISTIIPLTTIFMGVWIFGETASVTKITLLIAACILIGISSMQ